MRDSRKTPCIWRITAILVLAATLFCLPPAGALAQFTTIINSPPTMIGDNQSIGSNTQLNVYEGGEVGDLFNAGARNSVNVEVNITGGTVGRSFEAYSGSQVNISGGTVGNAFFANSGSEVNISGGAVGDGFLARSGSAVNVSRGSVGNGFTSKEGSQVTISGGTLGGDGNFAGDVTITGGTVGPFFTTSGSVTITGGNIGGVGTFTGSDVTVSGGEFLLNGIPPTGSSAVVDELFVHPLTGTLEDGTPFLLTRQTTHSDDSLIVNLTTAPLPPIDVTPIAVTGESAPRGLRQGQSLTLLDGGVLGDYFSVVNAILDIKGGEAGRGLKLAGSDVTISAGTLNDVQLFTDSELTISGGVIGDVTTANSEVTINGGSVSRVSNSIGRLLEENGATITGGTVDEIDGRNFRISGGTVGGGSASNVVITGGTVGTLVLGSSGETIFIAGGNVEPVWFFPRGQVNVYGTEFLLNGAEVAFPSWGQPIPLEGQISGTLADGSPFSFDRGIATLVSLLPGDYNSNGLVEQADLDLVLSHWGEDLFNPFGVGWINDLPTGIVDQEELDKVLSRWGGTTANPLAGAAIPEPTAGVLLFLATSMAFTAYRCGGTCRRPSKLRP